MKIKIILFILFLLPFFIISFYNQPSLDDFWSASAINDYGRMGSVKHFYQTVSARFFSNFLMSLFNTLPEGKIWIFKVWPMIIIVILTGSFYFFYSSLFKNIATANERWLASLFFVTVYIANIRVLFEGLYWMSSTICYQVAICIFAFGIGSLVRYLRSPSFLYGLLAIVCSMLLPGTAESLVPVFIIVLSIILAISLKENYPVKLIVACIVLSTLSLVFVAFSKGNIARVLDDKLSYNQDIFKALFYSARAVGFYNLLWISMPINIAAFILILPALHKLSAHVSLPAVLTLNPIYFILLSYLTCIIIYLPLTYFESITPFPRVTTLVFFVAAHLVFFIVWILIKQNIQVNRFALYVAIRKNFKLFAWGFFFLTAFTSRNFTIVVKDLLQGNAYNYNIEADNRIQLIQNAKGDTCYVPTYAHWPFFIQYSKMEIGNSNSFLRMNKYFGKTILYEKATK